MRNIVLQRKTGEDSVNDHTKDSDCTVDPETQCCIYCGVWHGEECPECKGRGFHNEGCSEYEG